MVKPNSEHKRAHKTEPRAKRTPKKHAAAAEPPKAGRHIELHPERSMACAKRGPYKVEGLRTAGCPKPRSGTPLRTCKTTRRNAARPAAAGKRKIFGSAQDDRSTQLTIQFEYTLANPAGGCSQRHRTGGVDKHPLTPIRFLRYAREQFPDKIGVVCGGERFHLCAIRGIAHRQCGWRALSSQQGRSPPLASLFSARTVIVC